VRDDDVDTEVALMATETKEGFNEGFVTAGEEEEEEEEKLVDSNESLCFQCPECNSKGPVSSRIGWFESSKNRSFFAFFQSCRLATLSPPTVSVHWTKAHLFTLRSVFRVCSLGGDSVASLHLLCEKRK
jgi:hypothetical protein